MDNSQGDLLNLGYLAWKKGQVTAGRGGLRAIYVSNFAVRADCRPSYCGAGRAAGYDVAKFAVRADWGPSYCGAGRAAGSDFRPRRALLDMYILL